MESYSLETYPSLSSPKCGIGIVVVNENFSDSQLKREGAVQEIQNLKNLFKNEFSLEFFCYKDMTWVNMEMLLLSLCEKRHTRYPCIEKKHQILVIAISSHGKSECFLTSDMKLISFNLIKEQFNAEKCPLLINKPKMFLFNCCRTLEDGVVREEMAFPLSERIETDCLESDKFSSEERELNKIRVASKWSDFITVNFCVRSIASLRSTSRGSLIIDEFCNAFRSYGHKLDFQSFMTAFTRDIKSIIFRTMEEHRESPITQCPEVITTLDRLIYFPKKEIRPRRMGTSEFPYIRRASIRYHESCLSSSFLNLHHSHPTYISNTRREFINAEIAQRSGFGRKIDINVITDDSPFLVSPRQHPAATQVELDQNELDTILHPSLNT